MTMNPEIREQWAKDLESGDYPQGRGFLRTDGGFCCLGVLCEQAVRAGVISRFGLDENPYTAEPAEDVSDGSASVYGTSLESPENSMAYLPLKLIRWADLNYADPHVICETDEETTLAELNDRGTSFGEIARLVREQL